ncbi:hypothetical protein DICVIV_01854 [Dictyocaulus viviparus]|uniref:Uncharacterized protein n=1 Tax=Dictyocaulus viviparus TaxID=29172 RepID=A0A0D8Y522_DICVI|nr:hypothetical protein DICVIV_01854 [Dictyocaulus viviparus]
MRMGIRRHDGFALLAIIDIFTAKCKQNRGMHHSWRRMFCFLFLPFVYRYRIYLHGFDFELSCS